MRLKINAYGMGLVLAMLSGAACHTSEDDRFVGSWSGRGGGFAYTQGYTPPSRLKQTLEDKISHAKAAGKAPSQADLDQLKTLASAKDEALSKDVDASLEVRADKTFTLKWGDTQVEGKWLVGQGQLALQPERVGGGTLDSWRSQPHPRGTRDITAMMALGLDAPEKFLTLPADTGSGSGAIGFTRNSKQ